MQDQELQIQMEVEDTELQIQMDAEEPEQSIELQTEDVNITFGRVNDVLVNGTSVVDNKIAYVNIKTVNNNSLIGDGNVNIPVPTKTSDLINDSDFVTNSEMTTAIGNEATARQNADIDLQNQIDAITVSSDVIDVLGTYQELENYDTSHVKANDIIKVLQDETHGDSMSYYRWEVIDHVGNWEYVGSEGPFYTKSETNALLNDKADVSALADYATITYVDNEIQDVVDAPYVVKEYATFSDFPDVSISYTYSTSFDYSWGPPEEYYTYSNGKWVTNIEDIYLYITNPPCPYTEEDLRNVTCTITSPLPTNLYPDITVDSFSLDYAYSGIYNEEINASYCPVLTTSYGDSEHNPYTLGLSLSFDIVFPPKLNPEVSPGVVYKALDTGKCYMIDMQTYTWVEYEDLSLDLVPVINMIDGQKQDKLVSGKTIKTINNDSILGEGNLNLATTTQLNDYLPKSYIRNSRSTSTSGYTYDVRYINGIIKTSRTTSSYNTYDCTYINSLIKTSRTTSSNYTYDCTYVNSLIKTANTSSDNATYSCNYIDNNFLTLETLPRWDGGNQ